jgi:hypothetical protein
MSGKTIQIFVPSGDPRNMRIAEVTTRIVRAFEAPRARLSEFIARSESSQVGIYFLFGEDDRGVPLCYIGQSGELAKRLSQHNTTKDFWGRVVAFVSLTNNWTQTHATFLEWTCIDEAIRTDRYRIENGNAGTRPYTPEAMEADCNEVYETLRLLLTTLGYPIFESLGQHGMPDQVLIKYLCTGKGGASAAGIYTPEGFVVHAGSKARKQLVDSLAAYEPFAAHRKLLLDTGKLIDEGATLSFTEDVLFSSPSRASSMVLGRSSNGWIDWVAPDGRTLDSIERKGDS